MICATATAQAIVACAARQRIGCASAQQYVVEIRADEVFDVAQLIAFGCTARRGGAIDRDVYARSGGGIVHSIDACAAVDAVRACAAVDQVVACAAAQVVVPAAANDNVVAGAAVQNVGLIAAGDAVVQRGADNAFDADELIVGRVATDALRSVQNDLYGARRRAVIDRVEAYTAVHDVGARAAQNAVVARAAANGIGRAAAAENVAESRPFENFDVGQAVAQGIAARAQRTVQRYRNASRRTGIACRVDAIAALNVVRACATVQNIVAAAAAKAVVASAAGDDVIARATGQHFIRRAAVQDIVEAGTSHIFDADKLIACRIAAAAGGPVKVDGDGDRGRRIVDSVATRTAIQHVRTAAAA